MSTRPPSPRARLRCRRGLSLIEVFVALGLFAISAATIGRFLVSHIRLGASNYLYTQAYVIAEQELESTRALRFSDMAPSSKLVSIDGKQFTVDTQMLNDTPANGLKQITVNVDWNDPLGPKHVAVRTIYTQVQR
jgi:Tfp pilus assembly protein PilV